jgi:hypothetical protein
MMPESCIPGIHFNKVTHGDLAGTVIASEQGFDFVRGGRRIRRCLLALGKSRQGTNQANKDYELRFHF